MGPRLASLALLLLALCRSSSALDYTIQSSDTKTQTSKTSIRTSAPNKVPPPPPQGKLTDTLRDEIILKGGYEEYAIRALGGAAATGELKDADLAAFNNGILCAYDEYYANTATSLLQAIYNGAARDETVEKTLPIAKDIDCAGAPGATEMAKCWCTDKHTIYFCGGLKYKATITTPKRKCLPEALAALKAAGTGTLGATYDLTALFKKQSDTALNKILTGGDGAVDAITKINDASAVMNKFFCDAIDSKVEAAMKDLMASDYSYSFLEQIIALAALATKENVGAVMNACAKQTSWAKTDFGECSCAGDRGFTFCLYKAIGKEFEKLGFLKCDGGKQEFVADKKPKAAPQLLPNADGSAATSAAASSSLLLLPLSAAAALLLRQ